MMLGASDPMRFEALKSSLETIAHKNAQSHSHKFREFDEVIGRRKHRL